MPRSLTTAFKNAAKANRVMGIVLFEGVFDSATLRLWNGVGDISWNSQTWTGLGNFLGLDPIEETSKTEAVGTRISLSGIDPSTISLALTEPYQGRTVTIYLALLDTSTGAIIANPDSIFSGRADVMAINDSGATCTIVLSVESILIDLQRPRQRRYEPEDQKLYYPTDKGLDYVPTLQDKTIVWE